MRVVTLKAEMMNWTGINRPIAMRIQRREFLTLSVGTTMAALLPQCASGRSPSLASGRLPSQIHRSQGGELTLDLEAREQSVQLGDRTLNLLTYNGQIPGPQLEAQAGDRVRINFHNRLDQPTNLHFHGLHIPPTDNADNVFLHIPPGGTHSYDFQIPPNHPAGTFWYHPHLHGLTAEQIFGGLAGVWLIRGALDEIPEIKAASEALLVLKDFAHDRHGLPLGHMAEMLGRQGDLLTVNGQIQPTFTMAAGGLLRLRCLNASASRFFELSLEEHSLYLIATDGGAIAQPVELQTLRLAPGERAEVLVRGDRAPGSYRLLNQAVNLGPGRMGGGMGNGQMGGRMMGGGMGHRMGGGMGNAPGSGQPEVIATLTYTGRRDLPPALPSQLLPIAALPEPQTVRQFTLSHGMGMGMGMTFLINGQMFDHDRIDTEVTLNTVEDWEIINQGTVAHPFHVHTNAFQVIQRNGQPVPYAAWKDVVVVEPGEWVRIRMPFRDYTGKTVYHCHIFDHEDRGMMGVLAIT